MRIKYIDKRFGNDAMFLLSQATDIIEEYADDNLQLTLRQLYYQFVSRDWFPDHKKYKHVGNNKWVLSDAASATINAPPNYKWLGEVISNGRLAGEIDWEAIEDRTRNLQTLYHNTDPGDAVDDALRCFRLNMWLEQTYRVEVWIEKEALTGVIARICQELDVPYFACKGYTSQSEMWRAGRRFKKHIDSGQYCRIIHLGDHDPSGIDMTRDIQDRLCLFAEIPTYSKELEVERIALNMDQVEEYDPPPNPAKLSDTRARKYVDEFGDSSWELDALEPRVIRDLIQKKVFEYRDLKLWEEEKAREKEYRDVLQNVVDNWETL